MPDTQRDQPLTRQTGQIRQPFATWRWPEKLRRLWCMRDKRSAYLLTHFKRVRANTGAQPSYDICSCLRLLYMG
ncbi:MAG: hypothetical protein AUK52_05625 [Comamonadaceae bacterium CG2_30_60_41]|nr:MAG: hypothetical protein AUK52_05625 [Comamonadaceae bacterium CG2_30_60_41]